MWTQTHTVHECDRETDIFTMTKTALCIASRGKNWSTFAKVTVKIKIATK